SMKILAVESGKCFGVRNDPCLHALGHQVNTLGGYAFEIPLVALREMGYPSFGCRGRNRPFGIDEQHDDLGPRLLGGMLKRIEGVIATTAKNELPVHLAGACSILLRGEQRVEALAKLCLAAGAIATAFDVNGNTRHGFP